MKRVRWTTNAADDLSRIVSYIRRDNPEAARRVARTIFNRVAELRRFPNRGRIGLAPNTRELIFAPWPYIAVYEVMDDHILVLRIRHAAQNWP
jgi:addiction module RelE/StbE family toxin